MQRLGAFYGKRNNLGNLSARYVLTLQGCDARGSEKLRAFGSLPTLPTTAEGVILHTRIMAPPPGLLPFRGPAYLEQLKLHGLSGGYNKNQGSADTSSSVEYLPYDS